MLSLGDATDYGLHLAVSQDALEWTPLNQNDPVVTPTEGGLGLRDPFVLRRQDGTFVVLATGLKGTDWNYVSQYIHVWYPTGLGAGGVLGRGPGPVRGDLLGRRRGRRRLPLLQEEPDTGGRPLHVARPDHVLRIDPISTATDRQDATFRVGD
ncbi:hypothetical protein BIV25_08555 [Streptomyces sp. MUSC 14]|nr:hypothetical protein BIV25_08555 [Streptomyces sp. MUSC 14]